MDIDFITIDSSVFVSAFIAGDCFYDISTNFFDAIGNSKFSVVMPLWVYIETINTLSHYFIGKDSLNKVYNFFDSHYFDWLKIDFDFIENCSGLFGKFKLKTGDVTIACTAHLYNSTVISWDQKLIRETRKNGLEAYTPAEFLKKVSC